MSKIALQDFSTISANELSAITRLNQNNAEIESKSDTFLSRVGTAPNAMETTLDMNGEKIINLPQALTNTEPVRYKEFKDAVLTDANAIIVDGIQDQIDDIVEQLNNDEDDPIDLGLIEEQLETVSDEPFDAWMDPLARYRVANRNTIPPTPYANPMLPTDPACPESEPNVEGGDPDGSPTRKRPASSNAMILDSGPLIIEDPNIKHRLTRSILSYRLEHEWRDGYASAGPPMGGYVNPRAYLRGGVILTANADTPEVALCQVNYNETTGASTASVFHTRGNLIGRIYENVVERNTSSDQTPVFKPRTNDQFFTHQAGVIFRSSENVEGTTESRPPREWDEAHVPMPVFTIRTPQPFGEDYEGFAPQNDNFDINDPNPEVVGIDQGPVGLLWIPLVLGFRRDHTYGKTLHPDSIPGVDERSLREHGFFEKQVYAIRKSKLLNPDHEDHDKDFYIFVMDPDPPPLPDFEDLEQNEL